MWHLWRLRVRAALLWTVLFYGLFWTHPLLWAVLGFGMMGAWMQVAWTTCRALLAPRQALASPGLPARRVRRVIFEEEVPYG